MTRHRSLLWALFAAGLMIMLGTSCAEMSFDEARAGAPYDDVDANSALVEAELALGNNNVARARDLYSQALERNPNHGAAAAGKAVTDILLLPGAPTVTAVLVENLGASRGLDANRLIYATNGYLYWLGRGTRWTDDGQYQGIRSLLADQLPWPASRLESLANFVEGLFSPVDVMMLNLVYVANRLEQIEDDLQLAIDDPDFRRLYIPGQTFHDVDLELVLGRSELALLQSLIAATRAMIYFTAAYEHAWNLEDAFGSWRLEVDLEDPLHVPEWTPMDYSASYLDGQILRAVNNPERLHGARAAMSQALEYLRTSITHGLAGEQDYTLKWSQADLHGVEVVDNFLGALELALYESTALPDTTPATVLDLSVFFGGLDQPRVLPEEIPWLVYRGPGTGHELNDAAKQTYFVDGVFSPSFEVGSGSAPKVKALDESASTLIDALLGDLRFALQDAFLTTR